jgi:hypothetical protein
MDRLARSSAVAGLGADGTATPAFELIEPQDGALLPLGFPEGDLERNPQLAAALRRLAARRLLVELPSARRPVDPVALILPIETLLGTELLALHRRWTAAQGVPLTFLVSHEELLADPLRYRYLRQMLRRSGHRLGLHSVPPALIDDRSLADADLRMFSWQSAYGDGATLRGPKPGEGRGAEVLISEIHTRDALAYARKFGAGLIAGRQAARLLGKI